MYCTLHMASKLMVIRNWAFTSRKFFISKQAHHLANIDPLHLAEMLITNLDAIL